MGERASLCRWIEARAVRRTGAPVRNDGSDHWLRGHALRRCDARTKRGTWCCARRKGQHGSSHLGRQGVSAGHGQVERRRVQALRQQRVRWHDDRHRLHRGTQEPEMHRGGSCRRHTQRGREGRGPPDAAWCDHLRDGVPSRGCCYWHGAAERRREHHATPVTEGRSREDGVGHVLWWDSTLVVRPARAGTRRRSEGCNQRGAGALRRDSTGVTSPQTVMMIRDGEVVGGPNRILEGVRVRVCCGAGVRCRVRLACTGGALADDTRRGGRARRRGVSLEVGDVGRRYNVVDGPKGPRPAAVVRPHVRHGG